MQANNKVRACSHLTGWLENQWKRNSLTVLFKRACNILMKASNEAETGLKIMLVRRKQKGCDGTMPHFEQRKDQWRVRSMQNISAEREHVLLSLIRAQLRGLGGHFRADLRVLRNKSPIGLRVIRSCLKRTSFLLNGQRNMQSILQVSDVNSSRRALTQLC